MIGSFWLGPVKNGHGHCTHSRVRIKGLWFYYHIMIILTLQAQQRTLLSKFFTKQYFFLYSNPEQDSKINCLKETDGVNWFFSFCYFFKKAIVTSIIFGWEWSKCVWSLRSWDSKIGFISIINWWIQLIFCMLIMMSSYFDS